MIASTTFNLAASAAQQAVPETAEVLMANAAAELIRSTGFQVAVFVAAATPTVFVTVDQADPRITWHTHHINTTPIVAGLTGNVPEIISPRGFHFSPGRRHRASVAGFCQGR